MFVALTRLTATLAVAGWITGAAWAAPHLPASDDIVLEQLRDAPLDAVARETRALRQALARAPRNVTLAVRVAQRDIEHARRSADPRYLGYAQAALAPWWTAAQPPIEVRVLRATLYQSNHLFDQALADLAPVLQTQPDHAQARFTRAMIYQARGEYSTARRDCAPLLRSANSWSGAACLASVASLSGQATQSLTLLNNLLRQSSALAPEEQRWLLTLTAEIAARAGDARTAEARFKQALAFPEPDSYLLAAYADFLLDQQRAQQVVTLLKGQERADGLLLRLALAQHALQAPEAAALIAALHARFAASQLRGDRVHLREQARFTLRLENRAQEALRLALENWAVQKEPADARIVLEAALAARDAAAAQPVLAWLAAQRLEDVALHRLTQQLAGLRT